MSERLTSPCRRDLGREERPIGEHPQLALLWAPLIAHCLAEAGVDELQIPTGRTVKREKAIADAKQLWGRAELLGAVPRAPENLDDLTGTVQHDQAVLTPPKRDNNVAVGRELAVRDPNKVNRVPISQAAGDKKVWFSYKPPNFRL